MLSMAVPLHTVILYSAYSLGRVGALCTVWLGCWWCAAPLERAAGVARCSGSDLEGSSQGTHLRGTI